MCNFLRQITTKPQLAIGGRSHQRAGKTVHQSEHQKPTLHIFGSDENDAGAKYGAESVPKKRSTIVF